MTESCRLYLITPAAFEPDKFRDLLARALDGGDVACVQLRLKQASDDDVRRAADILSTVTRERDVALILNDRPDLAAETGLDGVHIGQQDASYEEARGLLGDDRIVGVTCHDSRHLAMVAAEQGADYVAFGAFYPTATKDAIGHPAPEILTWWSETTTVPCVAIGGITVENCAVLATAGADFIAVLSDVWTFEAGPAAAVKAFNDELDRIGGAAPLPAA
jgi:thiamine-phosphate pyrophosphorylase